MKKTLFAAAVLLTVVSVFSFANGVKEDTTNPAWGPGYGRFGGNTTAQAARPFKQGDLVTVTGNLKLVQNDHPELVTSDGTYELMYPYIYSDDVDLKDGQEITVKGYDTPAYRWSSDGDEKHLMVTEATIDGKVYKIGRDDFGPMGMKGGRTGGRMAYSNMRGGMRSPRGGRR